MNVTAFAFFVVIIGATLVITYWATKKNVSTKSHYVAGGQIKGWQNGLAIAGDYVSAASFLGISGAIALTGFSGFTLAIGVPIAYLLVLMIVAEPLRNLGEYTLADMLTSRFNVRKVRSLAAINTIVISIIYMVVQFVGAGVIVQLLLGIDYSVAVITIGVLMTIYTLGGGMIATTWIQILKTVLLMIGTLVLTLLLLVQFGFNPIAPFNEAVASIGNEAVFTPPSGIVAGLDLISLEIGLALGVMGLPHVMIRFLTVPDARAARSSALTAIWVFSIFYLLLPIIGYGAAILVGRDAISAENPAGNLAAPQLAQELGGDIFLAFIAAVAFATILAVMAGVVIAASGAFAHDLYTNVFRRGEVTEGEQFRAARIAAAGISAVALVMALGARDFNLAFLANLAFAIAASANLPAILLTIYWRRFNTAGAITGMTAGLLVSVGLVLISPNMMGGSAVFPLTIPAIVSVPAGFLACYLGSVLSGTAREESEVPYEEIRVRANTGVEKAQSP